METLPVELARYILELVLDIHEHPGWILSVSPRWRKASADILHGRIRINSWTQLQRFVKNGRLYVIPQSFTFTITHPQPDNTTKPPWSTLRHALCKCSGLNELYLRIDAGMPISKLLYDALRAVNPLRFEWTITNYDDSREQGGLNDGAQRTTTFTNGHSQGSPTAFSAPALYADDLEPVFRAIKHWSNLERLTITDIHFALHDQTVLSDCFYIYPHRKLHSIRLCRTKGLSGRAILAVVQNVRSLERFVLEEEIYGGERNKIVEEEIEEAMKNIPKDHSLRKRIWEVVRLS